MNSCKYVWCSERLACKTTLFTNQMYDNKAMLGSLTCADCVFDSP
jgi:hypothetical protein